MVFYYFYRPTRKKTFLTRLCTCPLFDANGSYIIALGVLGVALSIFDLFRILRAGPILPCALWRERIKAGRIVTPECERDLKLVSLIFSVEYYGLLIYGTVSKNPACLLPLLCIYAITVVIEFLVFLLRMYTDGLDLDKHHLVSTMFVVFHWIVVYCAYREDDYSCPRKS